jgi:hypothetical protein
MRDDGVIGCGVYGQNTNMPLTRCLAGGNVVGEKPPIRRKENLID